MSEEIHPTAAEVAEAIDRIARTPDGANLYVMLQRHLMFVPATTEVSALQALHGERLFAARLIGQMAKGIHESGGRTSSTGGTGSSEQPIVAPISGPRTVGGSALRASARRAAIAAIDIGGARREPTDKT